jgi:hydroxyacylglutathione hydrolase
VAELLRPDHLPAVPPHWRRLRPQNLAGPAPLGTGPDPAALAEGGRTVVVAGAPGEVEEAAWGLLRVGLAAPAGYLDGGMEAWQAAGQPLATVARLDVAALRDRAAAGQVEPLDVRQPGEWADGHLPGARLLTAAELPVVAPSG